MIQVYVTWTCAVPGVTHARCRIEWLSVSGKEKEVKAKIEQGRLSD